MSTSTTTTNENANSTQKPPSASSSSEQTMCQKYNIRTHIITSQSDISSTNTSFIELYNMFLDDVNNTLKVIGVDVEWGVTETPALIQIASKRVCFVIVVARDPTLLEPFRGVLADKTVVKAGVGIRADKQKIEMIKYDVHGEVDLAAIVCRTPEANDVQSLSLARITAYYCGHSLNKDMAIVCSNWESEALSREQLEYAADDAVAGLMSFEAIMKKHINAGTNKTSRTAEPDSTLLAPTTPSAYYSSSPTTTTTTTTAENSSSPASTTATTTTSSAFSQSSPTSTTATTARVNRTPIEWSKKYIKRKVIMKQPKNNSNQSQPNAAAAGTAASGTNPIEQQDSSAGVIARFQSQMERRYQTVSQTQDSLERVAASGVQAVGPDDTNLFCLDLAKATWYVRKGIAKALEYDDNQTNDQGEKILKKIRLTFTPNKKTKVCRTWHINNGFCPNATCPFAHGADDLKESIQDETRELEESITAQQLAKAGLRSRCDMCRAQNAGINTLAVVPSPWLRLMGSEIADETGCSVGLHLCCKCQALMRAVFVSERRHLRQQAAKYFVGNDLHFGNGSTSGVDGDNDDNASSSSDEPDEDNLTEEDLNDLEKLAKNYRKKKQKKYEQKNKTPPEPEITLMAKITEASMTRMCSLCWLIAEKERLTNIPIFRLKEITFRINVFYETLVREGIMMEKSEHVKPLSSSSSSSSSSATTTSPSSTQRNNIDDNVFIKAFMKESEEHHRQLELERAERYREKMLKKKREQEMTQSSSFGGGDDEKRKEETNKKSKEEEKASSTTKKKSNTSTTAEQQALLDSDPYFKEAFERAKQIADRINQFSKSDWLSSAEARDIARYFCLRPVDERERAADIVTKEEEDHFIADMKQKLVEDQSLNRLRVCEVDFAEFWAKRMFEYYRTVFEQQLRPVVIPWKSYCRNPKQQREKESAEEEEEAKK